MLKVVRTRRVRAIDERFYGRTAAIFYVGVIRPEQARMLTNYLAAAAAESGAAHEADDLRAIIRHARIPRERAAEFWERVFQLTHEFMRLPRSGDTVYGFVAGLYPTDYPIPPTTPPCPTKMTAPGRQAWTRKGRLLRRGTDARSVKMGFLF